MGGVCRCLAPSEARSVDWNSPSAGSWLNKAKAQENHRSKKSLSFFLIAIGSQNFWYSLIGKLYLQCARTYGNNIREKDGLLPWRQEGI